MASQEKRKKEILKNRLEKKISGEIVLSDDPGKTIKKWRNIFEVSQRSLADEMGVMPSVISDYELGRRKSPGVRMIKKIVDGLLTVDEKRGSEVIKEFSDFSPTNIISDSIIDIKEFSSGVTISEFCEAAEAELTANKDKAGSNIYGYSIINSLKAIVELSPSELVKLYGLTTERALVFTQVSTGRSPMVAIKVTNLKPGLVLFHGKIKKVDRLAKRIAEAENVPVGVTRIKTVEKLKNKLSESFK